MSQKFYNYKLKSYSRHSHNVVKMNHSALKLIINNNNANKKQNVRHVVVKSYLLPEAELVILSLSVGLSFSRAYFSSTTLSFVFLLLS